MIHANQPKPDNPEEFAKAGQRIMSQSGFYGGPRPCALAWLLTFAQEPLDTLGFGGWSDRWQEVKRFAADAGLGEEVPGNSLWSQRGVRLKLPPRMHSPWTSSRPDAGPGERDWLKGLQSALLVDLQHYVNRGEIRSGHLSVELFVKPETPGIAFQSLDLDTGVMYQMFHLIGELGHRIRQCRGCERLFLAGRTDKEFCSGLCQAKTYKREHSKTRSKKGAKRHGRKTSRRQSTQG